MPNDAVQKFPSLEEQAAQFKGFSMSSTPVAKTPAADDKTKQPPANEDDAADEIETEEGDEVVQETAEEKATREAAETEARANETPEQKAAREAAEKAPKKPNKVPASVRIAQLTKANRTTERLFDQYRGKTEAELAELRRQVTDIAKRGLTEGKRNATHDPNVEPSPNDYEYGELDTRYLDAKVEYRVRQTLKAVRADEDKNRQSEAASAQEEKFAELAAAFEEAGAAKFDDFMEVVVEGARNQDWKPTPVIAELCVTTEHGPEIAYHLATHPKEMRQVSAMSPTAQAAYFGRLEAKLSSETDATTTRTAKPGPAVTKAPTPLSEKARGSASGSTQADPATKDFAKFEAMMRGQR